MLYYSMYGLHSHRQWPGMPRKKVVKKIPGPLAASGPPPPPHFRGCHNIYEPGKEKFEV
jgi:hypothetical protein